MQQLHQPTYHHEISGACDACLGPEFSPSRPQNFNQEAAICLLVISGRINLKKRQPFVHYQQRKDEQRTVITKTGLSSPYKATTEIVQSSTTTLQKHRSQITHKIDPYVFGKLDI